MEVAGIGHLPHREHLRSDWDSALLTLEILMTEPRAGNNPGDRYSVLNGYSNSESWVYRSANRPENTDGKRALS